MSDESTTSMMDVTSTSSSLKTGPTKRRAALHVVTSPEAGGWPAAAAALPAHLRTELDHLNLKAQENLPAVRTMLDHLLRKQKGA